MRNGAYNKKGRRQQGLATTGTTTHERGPPGGKTSASQLVEARDSAGDFLELIDHRSNLVASA